MDLSNFSGQLARRELPLSFPGHWIGNKWSKYPNAKPTTPSISPNTGELLLSCTSDKQIMLDALTHAEAVLPKLAQTTLEQRLESIRRMRQALTDYRESMLASLHVQSGKPAWEADNDFDAAIKFFDYVIESAPVLDKIMLGPVAFEKLSGVHSSTPIGSVVAYLPFSTPMVSFAKYFSSATIAGCPLILCPSMHASICSVMIGGLAETIDLIPGSFAIAFGTFENFQSVISDRRIQAIIYTGSREHCELIRRESRSVPGRQLVLQSGGKNAALIHSSADMEIAVNAVTLGTLKGCGQLCASTSRVFVHKSLTANFSEALVAKMQSVKIGRTDTAQNEVFMGPLYSKKAVDKFLRYQTMAHREAQRDLMWGKAIETKEDGCLVTPGVHLMKQFDRNSGYQTNVLFCPDLAIYEYEVLDQAIDMVNGTDAPYCVSFVGDENILSERRSQFIAPNLLLNLPTVVVENHPMLAGKLHSGHHRFNGLGLCLMLCYPQFTHTREGYTDLLKRWPF